VTESLAESLARGVAMRTEQEMENQLAREFEPSARVALEARLPRAHDNLRHAVLRAIEDYTETVINGQPKR
jgi:hypothetical protein